MENAPSGNARSLLRADPAFRWFAAGSGVSLLGDQFSLVALPWLVLGLTRDPLVLGWVLALLSLPRALLILLGGALSDRHSPRRVLMATKSVNMVLLGLFAFLVATGLLRTWMVFAFALGTGAASAFSFPSGSAVCAQVVHPRHLRAAHSILMSMRQTAMLAGPILAVTLIALFRGGSSGPTSGRKGLGLAFAFDAFSFAFSAWTLTRVPRDPARGAPSRRGISMLRAILSCLRHFWRDQSLRAFCLFAGAVNLFTSGPLQVGLPLLAGAGRPHGAPVFGLWMSAYGAGTLAGMVLSGILPLSLETRLGRAALLANGLAGLFMTPIGHVRSPLACALLLALMGLPGGFIRTLFLTWIQRRVPHGMLGRAMSLFLFIYMGLAPLSAAASGWLARRLPPPALFMLCGGALMATVLTAWAAPAFREISQG